VVGYSPGGLPDTIARLIGQKLSERWGQQFVVENKPGANGILGAISSRSGADGYTLLMTDNSTHAILPFLFTKLLYDATGTSFPYRSAARAPLFSRAPVGEGEFLPGADRADQDRSGQVQLRLSGMAHASPVHSVPARR